MRRMWLDRLPDILETLRAKPKKGLWRQDVEQLFGLSKEAALQIMRAADTRIINRKTKALAVISDDILGLLQRIPSCPIDATPAQHRKWVAEANTVVADLLSNLRKSRGGVESESSVQNGDTQVLIPAGLATAARKAAAVESISLDEWVAGVISRETKKRVRSRRQPVPQEEPTVFPDDDVQSKAHPKSS